MFSGSNPCAVNPHVCLRSTVIYASSTCRIHHHYVSLIWLESRHIIVLYAVNPFKLPPISAITDPLCIRHLFHTQSAKNNPKPLSHCSISRNPYIIYWGQIYNIILTRCQKFKFILLTFTQGCTENNMTQHKSFITLFSLTQAQRLTFINLFLS